MSAYDELLAAYKELSSMPLRSISPTNEDIEWLREQLRKSPQERAEDARRHELEQRWLANANEAVGDWKRRAVRK